MPSGIRIDASVIEWLDIRIGNVQPLSPRRLSGGGVSPPMEAHVRNPNYRMTKSWSVLLSALMLTACANSAGMAPAGPAAAPGAASATAASGQVAGQATALTAAASLGAPLAGATVKLFGLDGAALPQAPAGLATNAADGGFEIPAAGLPADFRIVVAGGTAGGKAFDGELRREVRGWKAGDAKIMIDLGTTLASHYLEAHPEAGVAGAEAAVKAHLAIPAAVALGSPEAAKRFDGAAYLAAPPAEGGLKAEMAAALAQIDAAKANAGAAMPDPTEEPRPKYGELVAKFVGSNLASGVVSGLAGYGLNHFLAAVGAPGDPALAAINAKLDLLIAKVDAISASVQDVKKLVVVGDASNNFKSQNTLLMVPIETKLGAIDVHVKSLSKIQKDLLEAKTPAETADAKERLAGKQVELKKAIVKAFPNWRVTLDDFHHRLVARPGASEVLLMDWQRLVSARHDRYYNLQAASEVATQWEYWDGLQAKLVVYLLSAVQADAYPRDLETRSRDEEVKSLLSIWQANRAAQIAELRGMPPGMEQDVLDLSKFGLPNQVTAVKTLPPGVVVDRGSKLMWTTSEAGWTVWDRAIYDPAIGTALWFTRPGDLGTAMQTAQDRTAKGGWRIPTPDEFLALRKDREQETTFAAIGMAPVLDAHTRVFWTSLRWYEKGGLAWQPKVGTYWNRTERVPEADLEHVPKYRQAYVQVWDGKLRYLDGYVRWRPDWIHPDHWRQGMMIVPTREVPAAELATYAY